MNLLIPDPIVLSSYSILKGMKPYCHKIIVSIPTKSRFSSLLAFTAKSRDVDKVYSTINPVEAWLREGHENQTPEEKKYIEEIVNICLKEKITVIYPSWDPLVLIFSRNMDVFRRMGILIPVLEYSTLLKIMDKYELAKCAAMFGVPIPKTKLIRNEETLKEQIGFLKFPVFLKPRFGFGAFGTFKAENLDELLKFYAKAHDTYGEFILQEFIPGREHTATSILFNKDHQYDSRFSCFWLSDRPDIKVFQNMVFAFETMKPQGNFHGMVNMLESIGYRGFANGQWRRDVNDGQFKLIEIGTRVTQYSWMAMSLGFNVPFSIYQVFKGEDLSAQKFEQPVETIFLSPVEDWTSFFVYCWCWIQKIFYKYFLRSSRNPFLNLIGFKEILRDYHEKYFLKRKRRWHVMIKNFVKEPAVSVFYWISCVYRIVSKEYPGSFQG